MKASNSDELDLGFGFADMPATCRDVPRPNFAPERSEAEWWRTAVIYEIYPRSFADANGDGIGDLLGVRRRLPYLADLGIDAIWLTPFYPSPLADGGYDISDYRDVDPRLGSLTDFDDLTSAAHTLGIKILVDIVPNHTSEEHPWFREAVAAGPHSEARRRYIFRDGTGPDGDEPPTDWRSHFGGSAWQRVPDGQWYCHLFAREQPDLNWDNPEVREYFLNTLRFWADRGVDGFRVDVAHGLAKDLTEPLRSQPNLDANLPSDGTDPLYDRTEVHHIYETWRQVFDQYDPPRMAVAETWTPTTSRNHLYGRPTELGQVFDFSLLKSTWNRDQLRSVIDDALTHNREAGGGLTWVLSSHDVPRHASRLAHGDDVDLDAWLLSGGTSPRADERLGLRRARAATLMMLALPGSAYLYQGEELGLPEVTDIPVHLLHDPIYQRTSGALKGRDGCRVPIPWTRSGPSFGFSTGPGWLRQPDDFASHSVEAQDHVPGSTLEMYRAALAIRRGSAALQSNQMTWVDTTAEVLAFSRGAGFYCVTNFAANPLPLPVGATVLVTSAAGAGGNKIPAETAVWIAADPNHVPGQGRPRPGRQ